MQRLAKGLASLNYALPLFTCLMLSWSAVVHADAGQHYYRPYIDLSLEPGSARHLGRADLIAPLWQARDQLVFMNLRGQFDDQDSKEGNLGLGYRRLLDGDKAIFGSYAYADVRRTAQDNRFYQIMAGSEYLSKPFDMRLNGYVPLKERAFFTPRQQRIIASSERVQLRYENSEYALYGIDGELGLGLLPSLTGENDLRFYVGGYHFFRTGVQSISGPRARLELRLNDLKRHASWLPSGSRVTLGAELQHDKLRGTQSFGMLRIRIPFSSKARPAQRGMRGRMSDPVIRDVDVVTRVVTSTEDALFADSGAPIRGLERASTAVELYRQTTLGRDNTIVVMEEDITTSLPNQLQSGQWLVSGLAALVPVKTASGVSYAYRPATGAQRMLTQILPGAAPVSGNIDARVVDVETTKTEFDGAQSRNPPVLSTVLHDLPADKNALARVAAYSRDGTALRFAITCDTPDEKCPTLRIDPATGVISRMSGGAAQPGGSEPDGLFDVIVLDAAGGSATQSFYLPAEEERTVAMQVTQPGGTLPNQEIVNGIILRYGNDYLCSGDDDSFDGVCDRSGESKLAYVKRTIAALLSHDQQQGGRISAALARNMPTLTLFNSSDDLDDSEPFLGVSPATQDLQAEEVFVGAENRAGRSANGERSATIEEIVHLIHNYGITPAYPELQLELDRLTAAALESDLLTNVYDDDSGIDTSPGGDLPREDLDDEYFAIAVEAYFNLRSDASTIRRESVCILRPGPGRCMPGVRPRDELRNNHPGIYRLIERLFGAREELY